MTLIKARPGKSSKMTEKGYFRFRHFVLKRLCFSRFRPVIILLWRKNRSQKFTFQIGHWATFMTSQDSWTQIFLDSGPQRQFYIVGIIQAFQTVSNTFFRRDVQKPAIGFVWRISSINLLLRADWKKLFSFKTRLAKGPNTAESGNFSFRLMVGAKLVDVNFVNKN